MANKELTMIEIRPEVILEGMKEKAVSFRELAKKIDCISDRQLRTRIKQGKMPPYLVSKICHALFLCPSDVIAGKTIWIRLGVTVPVDDDTLKMLMGWARENSASGTSFEDVDFSDYIGEEMLRRAVADGESYIPGCCFDEHEKWWEDQKNEI